MRRSAAKAISTGVHDIFIERPVNGTNLIIITTDCGGAAEEGIDANAIPNGTVVRLRRNAVSQLVTTFTESASECTQNAIRISPAMAKKFGIVNDTRYTVTYNSVTRVLRLCRKPVTELQVSPVLSAQQKIGTIGIGDGLAAQFGINLRSGMFITVVRRRVRLRLRYMELFDPDFFSYAYNLNPADALKLGITGKETTSAYNQITRTLVIS
ncbi:hypothetical protein ACFPVX_18380 [Cohnella faecalis]|uniref:Uncharacterized protein n=1 Tax=Cohnella faecalis TaxID=2315694 RepID=A0A398CK36_9BACL|nr:hypothetical protein [Cohnella faecalis]RIE01228.1 hypothetical protein D3H35_22810 [Cohnella faecalis]